MPETISRRQLGIGPNKKPMRAGENPKSRLKLVNSSDDAMLHCMQWLTWSLLSALFAAATALLSKIGIEGINSHLATAWRTSVVLVFVWGIAFATNRPETVLELSRRNWLFLFLSGIATGLSWLCYFRALQLGDASRVAPVDKLSVVLVILFAAIFLGEPLTWRTIAGGGMIALGATIIALK